MDLIIENFVATDFWDVYAILNQSGLKHPMVLYG